LGETAAAFSVHVTPFCSVETAFVLEGNSFRSPEMTQESGFLSNPFYVPPRQKAHLFLFDARPLIFLSKYLKDIKIGEIKSITICCSRFHTD
jgi:hypothetical protein